MNIARGGSSLAALPLRLRLHLVTLKMRRKRRQRPPKTTSTVREAIVEVGHIHFVGAHHHHGPQGWMLYTTTT